MEITLRSRDPDTPSFQTTGYVPYSDCPLAVVHQAMFDEASRTWRANNLWCITHRPTGYALGSPPRTWSTKAEALAALERCDPTFAAWALATGAEGDAATTACRYKFRVASGQ